MHTIEHNAFLAMSLFILIIIVIPTFIVIEIYHIFRMTNRIEKPYKICISSCLIVVLVVDILMILNSSGESGMIGNAFAILFLICAVIIGTIVGSIYSVRKTTFLSFFIKKLNR